MHHSDFALLQASRYGCSFLSSLIERLELPDPVGRRGEIWLVSRV